MTMLNTERPSPAHATKHVRVLRYPFQGSVFYLSQIDSGGETTGTTLWLGAQCLSVYFADSHSKIRSRSSGIRPKAVELGSGIGLTALALSSLGWDVLATDIANVLDTVLIPNITTNKPNLPQNSGLIQVRVLDWTVPPEQWTWDNDRAIASSTGSTAQAVKTSTLTYDMIFSSDTLYAPSLVQPLFRSLHALCQLSNSSSPPPVYLCIERRDPMLIDRALMEAKDIWKFNVQRIPQKKLSKLVKGRVGWDREEWDGVELWKLTLD